MLCIAEGGATGHYTSRETIVRVDIKLAVPSIRSPRDHPGPSIHEAFGLALGMMGQGEPLRKWPSSRSTEWRAQRAVSRHEWIAPGLPQLRSCRVPPKAVSRGTREREIIIRVCRKIAVPRSEERRVGKE